MVGAWCSKEGLTDLAMQAMGAYSVAEPDVLLQSYLGWGVGASSCGFLEWVWRRFEVNGL